VYIADMQRVMIVGGPGSGKSTLARRLGDLTGLPVVYVDHIHWKPGWIERARDEKIALAREVHQRPAWIFEGGLFSTFDERLARADTFIWLDCSVWRRLWRVMYRTMRDLGKTRPDLPDNCPERIDLETLKFVHFIWSTRNRWRSKIVQVIESPPPCLTCHHFTSTAQIDAYLETLGRNQSSCP
jgi:adenylate kinase family enzyme